VAVTFFFLTQFYQFVQGRSASKQAPSAPVAITMGVGAPLSGIFVKRFVRRPWL